MHFTRTFEIPYADSWLPGLKTAALVLSAVAAGAAIAMEQWLILAAAFGILLVVVWPIEVALGVYTFLIPFESLTSTSDTAAPAVTLLRYIGGGTLLVLVLTGLLRERLIKPPRAALFWSALVVWGMASTIWAIDSALVGKRIPTALSLWVLYLGLVSVRLRPQEMSRITLFTVLGGAAASAYAAFTFFQSGNMMQRAAITKGQVESDPNFFAATLLLPFALALGEVFAGGRWTRRLFYIANAGVIALGILLTMSRGALVAVTAITFVFLLRFGLKWRLMLPVALLGMALLFMPQTFFQRVQETSTTRLAGRLDIWTAGVRAFISHAAIGAGLDNFGNAYDEHAGAATFFAGGTRASHNIYLAAAVELGIPGLLLLLTAIRFHLRAFQEQCTGRASSPRLVAFEAACWGMLIAGLSLDLLWRKAFWLVWALPVLALRAEREQQDSTPEQF
jgi:O-antigen ligase